MTICGNPLSTDFSSSLRRDIELEHVEGVHIPRRLDVIIVKGL